MDKKQVRALLVGLRGEADETLQFVRADAHQALPWSLVYDWDVPAAGAPVCWGSAPGAPSCGHGPDGTALCVRGFWGVRHRVEELVNAGGDVRMEVAGDATIDLAFGVTDASTAQLQADLEELTTTAILKPQDSLLDRLWVGATRAAVVSVVGHFDAASQSIGCGTAEKQLSPTMIRDRSIADGDWDDPHPLVMLMACESGVVTPADVTSHLLVLTAAGAGAIVATESIVRVSHVHAFARRFLAALLGRAADPAPTALAVAIQHARMDALATDRLLAVLAFTAFGCADLVAAPHWSAR